MNPNRTKLNNGKESTPKIGDRPDVLAGLKKSVFTGIPITAKFRDFSPTKSYTRLTVDFSTTNKINMKKVDLMVVNGKNGIAINGETKSPFVWSLYAINDPSEIVALNIRFERNDFRVAIGGTIHLTVKSNDGNVELTEKFYISDDKFITKLAGLEKSTNVDSETTTVITNNDIKSPRDLMSTLAKIQANK